MVIDTSALIAIVLGEEDAEQFERAITEAIRRSERLFVPASVVVEAGAVLDSRGRGAAFDRLLDGLEPTIVAIDEKIAWAARKAYRAFGKRSHPAKLNFGDCLSYAVCAELGEALLFKGDDFAKTDVRSAL